MSRAIGGHIPRGARTEKTWPTFDAMTAWAQAILDEIEKAEHLTQGDLTLKA